MAAEPRAAEILDELPARSPAGERLAERLAARLGRATTCCSPRFFRRLELADPWSAPGGLAAGLGPVGLDLAALRRAELQSPRPRPPRGGSWRPLPTHSEERRPPVPGEHHPPAEGRPPVPPPRPPPSTRQVRAGPRSGRIRFPGAAPSRAPTPAPARPAAAGRGASTPGGTSGTSSPRSPPPPGRDLDLDDLFGLGGGPLRPRRRDPEEDR